MAKKENKSCENEEVIKNCHCGENCECDDTCGCGHECNCDENCTCGDDCSCGEKCNCGEKCDCSDDCGCGSEGCTCGEECSCHDEERCSDTCTCEHGSKEQEYLNLARQIQADFENYRRRSQEEVKSSYSKGQAAVIEVFLPCLDTFKEAKKMITDETVLKGVNMIEDKIGDALKSLGVQKISSIGEKYNPHFHNVIAVLKDESKENDIILDEYQAGYTLNDKVIRYAKVIVNKKED